MASNNSLNFQASAIDTSLSNSLAQLASGFNQAGIGQANFVNTSIQQDKDAQFKRDKLKSDETQQGIQNQISYDNLGVNKEKVAIENYNRDAKNKASYEAMFRQGIVKEPYTTGVDYGTQFDIIQKDLVNKANIAQSNAAVNASNSTTSLNNLTIAEVNRQNKTKEAEANAKVYMTTPQTTDVTNPEWIKNKEVVNNTTLVNPLDGVQQFDPSQITSLKQLSQKETELANLQKNSPVVNQGVGYNGPRMTVTPEVEKLTNEVNSLKSQVSPEVLQKVYPYIANGSYDKYTADKSLVDNANTFISNPANQTIKETRTPTAQETLDYYKSQGADARTLNAIAQTLIGGDTNSTGLASYGTGSNSPIASQVNKVTGRNDTKDVRDQIYLQEHTKKALSEKEQYAINFNKYSKALQDAGINAEAIKTNTGLEEAIKANLTPEGLPKNSPIVKEKLLATTLNDLVSKNKDDTDNNSANNISQFIDSNKAVLSQIPTQELESFLAGVQSEYKNQGTAFFKNLGDNSAIGDSLDNRIKIWNQSHPNKLHLTDSQIGKSN